MNNDLKSLIRTIPNWPKEGIMFRDITTLLLDSNGLKKTIDLLVERYQDRDIDFVVGMEARGFIIGPMIAYQLGKGFVPIRKKGKLPGKTISQDYQLEYGTDTMEIHDDALPKGSRVLLVDDLLATGGTILGAIELIHKLEAIVEETCFIVDLPDLGGGKKLDQKNIKWHTLVEFEGE